MGKEFQKGFPAETGKMGDLKHGAISKEITGGSELRNRLTVN